MTQEKKDRSLSSGEQDALASFLVATSGFIVAINLLLFTWPLQTSVVALDGIYLLILPGYILLLSKKSESLLLKKFMFILGIASISAIFLLFVGLASFLENFRF